MPTCPNCGLETQRTKDWVCQWCGYPLLSKSYETIDKTYKELQEERAAQTTPPEPAQPQPQPEYTPEPQPRIEQPEQPAYEMPEQAASPPQPQPNEEPTATEPPAEPQPEAVTQPVPEPPTQPESEMTAPPVDETPVQPEPDVAEPVEDIAPEPPQYEQETPPEPETPPAQPEPQNEVEQEQTPAAEPLPAENQPLPSASKPEFNVEPEPAPDFEIEPEDIEDGMEIAVEQIDALFRKNKDIANQVFNGKTFTINGIVEKVFVREHLDIRYIVLTGIMQGISWNLRCTFEKENTREISGLQEGQVVKVQGAYDGVGKNIIFKNCTIIQ